MSFNAHYRDLEQAVEELRADVLSRQCRVQMSDVEGMALVLSHVTKSLGDLKGIVSLRKHTHAIYRDILSCKN